AGLDQGQMIPSADGRRPGVGGQEHAIAGRGDSKKSGVADAGVVVAVAKNPLVLTAGTGVLAGDDGQTAGWQGVELDPGLQRSVGPKVQGAVYRIAHVNVALQPVILE